MDLNDKKKPEKFDVQKAKPIIGLLNGIAIVFSILFFFYSYIIIFVKNNFDFFVWFQRILAFGIIIYLFFLFKNNKSKKPIPWPLLLLGLLIIIITILISKFISLAIVENGGL